jgi:Carbohydrate esterase, sialic acid-specific acetylesterase
MKDSTFSTLVWLGILLASNGCYNVSETAGSDGGQDADALVFLILGQSNSRGAAGFATLQPQYEDGPLEGAFFFNGTDFVPMDAADRGSSNQYPQITQTFGSEFSLAARLRKHFGKDIYIVKYAVGSTPLDVDSGQDWNAASSEELLDGFYDTWTAAETWLDEGAIDYIVGGLVWTQGERDSKTANYAEAYKKNFEELLGDIKTTLKLPNLKVVCNRTHVRLPAGGYPFVGKVRAAQDAVMDASPNHFLVNTDDFPLTPNLIHFDATGYDQMGQADFEIFAAEL